MAPVAECSQSEGNECSVNPVVSRTPGVNTPLAEVVGESSGDGVVFSMNSFVL